MSALVRPAAGVLVIALAAGCARSEPADTTAGDPTIVATIGGEPIAAAELDAWIKEDLFRKQTEGKAPAALYTLRAKALGEMIEERLLEEEARRHNLDPQGLLDQEVVVPEVAETQVVEFYEANRARLGNSNLEDVAPRIRQYLEQQAPGQARAGYIASLRERADVEVRLEPPRAEVAATGPSLGPESAPVTIVEFSDFQCPFCARAEPVVRQLLERYPQEVRLVYRHLPLESIHPRARAAAEASACAHEQGRFWEYHSLLFANNRALADADLERYAAQLQLDADAFKACVGERRYGQLVDEDLRAASSLGARGTPAFFVNGILLSGAQPLEAFVRVVEAELRRLGVERAEPS